MPKPGPLILMRKIIHVEQNQTTDEVQRLKQENTAWNAVSKTLSKTIYYIFRIAFVENQFYGHLQNVPFAH